MWFNQAKIERQMEQARSSRSADWAQKTAASNKARHGEDFYKRIGAMGGKVGRTGGFYANRELARVAGAKGGRNGKRGKSVTII